MKDELLFKITSLVTQQTSSESDIDHLMTLIRKLKERTKERVEIYSLLDFFCDWTKHTKLDRNSEGHKIIVELNELLTRLKDESNNNSIIEGVSKIISFERLQIELKNFLSYYDLPTDIVSKKNLWLRYIINLINIVSDCTLELPERKRNMVKNNIKEGVVAVSLKYIWINEGMFTHGRPVSKQNALALSIGLSDTTTIIMPSKILGKFITSKIT